MGVFDPDHFDPFLDPEHAQLLPGTLEGPDRSTHKLHRRHLGNHQIPEI